ncbi:extracellular solute-binding protein, family 5 [Trichormus variabilis ATCC 29413]|uniref:Extracellular solute-binding protein, family 5 n=2 Tax=Anabaena variabilis TaxID=264691 RepID=Q3MC54_TRIV2|nr:MULTISPECIES: ABC transporter substrate-binding protein [Nostocaceae]ABA21432.1 extracellular solute-binding protein, family 5 [Trichormus variabilis ATCC 29413]MBC1216248.1 ABC transporter substrate-binding protein [Trichormus variabilis ARAD]MBC1254266.1 ABC transporter substrate-binding protein [Trichormus variabilis V5]MBC1268174.1 ABC transporter substrate-binding protein [Trichormus variabilis FSR]MBC1301100.1 ABC transporter substrate-binding protein [Trichormus variabilis N2B]
MPYTNNLISLIKRFWILIILAAFTAVTVAACNPSNFKSSAAQIPQLVTSILSDPKTFNYPLSSESPNVFGLIYEGLISENYDTGEVEPALAESWTISDDKLKIVFTLREGLKWSDGQPLTVDDVVFTYNDIYFNEAIPTDVRDIMRIGESRKLPTVRKVDSRRVEFAVPEPFAPFLRSATSAAILPAHALRESIQTKDSEGKPKFLQKWGVDTPPDQIVGNGLYKLERYDTSERVVFRRNPYYWRKGPKGEAQPYIERLVWQIVESTDTSLLQFRSGGLDSIGVSPDYFSLLKVQEKQGNFKIYNGGPAAGTTFILFNLNKGQRDGKPLVDPVKSRWFNTVEFRQAVAYAVDRQTMINNIYRGLGQTQDSPISVQSPYYLSPKEGLKVYDYNLEKAKQLLLKAGFKYNAQNQLLDSDGNRVRFTLLTNAGNKIREAMGSQIKQDLSKIGIQVDFTPLAWNTYTDKLANTLDWEASMLGLTGGLEPNDGANVWNPEGGLHMFNQKPQAGQKPITGWEVAPWEAKIGQLYIQGARELDETKRKTIYAETQKITQENLPFIYLVNPYSLSAVRDRFAGIRFSALGGAFWNLYEIKIVK